MQYATDFLCSHLARCSLIAVRFGLWHLAAGNMRANDEPPREGGRARAETKKKTNEWPHLIDELHCERSITRERNESESERIADTPTARRCQPSAHQQRATTVGHATHNFLMCAKSVINFLYLAAQTRRLHVSSRCALCPNRSPCQRVAFRRLFLFSF